MAGGALTPVVPARPSAAPPVRSCDVEVRVEPLDNGSWSVRVRGDEGSETATDHVVTVPDGYARTIGCTGVSDAELVRASFTFLLEREPPSAILGRFDLSVISTYFPEYADAVRCYVHPGPGGGSPGGEAAG